MAELIEAGQSAAKGGDASSRYAFVLIGTTKLLDFGTDLYSGIDLLLTTKHAYLPPSLAPLLIAAGSLEFLVELGKARNRWRLAEPPEKARVPWDTKLDLCFQLTVQNVRKVIAMEVEEPQIEFDDLENTLDGIETGNEQVEEQTEESNVRMAEWEERKRDMAEQRARMEALETQIQLNIQQQVQVQTEKLAKLEKGWFKRKEKEEGKADLRKLQLELEQKRLEAAVKEAEWQAAYERQRREQEAKVRGASMQNHQLNDKVRRMEEEKRQRLKESRIAEETIRKVAGLTVCGCAAAGAGADADADASDEGDGAAASDDDAACTKADDVGAFVGALVGMCVEAGGVPRWSTQYESQ
eukprot:g1528.t1